MKKLKIIEVKDNNCEEVEKHLNDGWSIRSIENKLYYSSNVYSGRYETSLLFILMKSEVNITGSE